MHHAIAYDYITLASSAEHNTRLGEKFGCFFTDVSTIDMIISISNSTLLQTCIKISILERLCVLNTNIIGREGGATHCLLHLDEVLYSQHKLFDPPIKDLTMNSPEVPFVFGECATFLR